MKKVGKGLGQGVSHGTRQIGAGIQSASETLGVGAVGAGVNSLVSGVGGGVGQTVEGGKCAFLLSIFVMIFKNNSVQTFIFVILSEVGEGGSKIIKGAGKGVGQIVGGGKAVAVFRCLTICLII